jgi:hypothetical protein
VPAGRGCWGRARLIANPDKQIVLTAIHLLPHLEEAVGRVARVGAIADMVGDLERAVEQAGRKARIRHILTLAESTGRPRLRQRGIAAVTAGVGV